MRSIRSITVGALCVCLGTGSTAFASDARAAFDRGVAALEAGETDRALALFTEVCQLAPGWAHGYLYRGMAETRLRPDSPEAITAFERAVSLAENNPRARYHLGSTYLRARRSSAAVEQLRVVERLRPRYRDTRFLLASALGASEQYADAVAAYEIVLSDSPDHLGALAALADLYEQQQRARDAEQALITITELQPAVAYHHYQLGQFYERTGEARKARAAFRRANHLDPRPQRKMRRLR